MKSYAGKCVSSKEAGIRRPRSTAPKQRVDRLNYFNAVSVETPAVPGTTDQIDINVEVKEKPTGAVMFGAGYSNMEGLILSGSIAQDNIFGTGKFVNLMVNTGSVNKTYSLSYTDPYFTKDGITAGFDIYKTDPEYKHACCGE